MLIGFVFYAIFAPTIRMKAFSSTVRLDQLVLGCFNSLALISSFDLSLMEVDSTSNKWERKIETVTVMTMMIYQEVEMNEEETATVVRTAADLAAAEIKCQ